MLGCSVVTGSSGDETTWTLDAGTARTTPQNSAVAGNLGPHREEPVMFSCLVFSSLAFFFHFLMYSFTYFCGGSLLLRRLCSSSGEQELRFAAVHGLLIAVASLVAEHRRQGMRLSAVASRGLRSCGSQL